MHTYINSFHATHIQAECVYKHIVPSIKPCTYKVLLAYRVNGHIYVSVAG